RSDGHPAAVDGQRRAGDVARCVAGQEQQWAVELLRLAPTLVFGDQRLTFAGLHERSSRAAQALRASGVQPGDRVALLMKDTSDFYVLAVACSKVDATVVALNWRLAAAELAAIIADAEPALLGMAVGSFTSVSLDPPLVAFLPDKSSSSFP